MFSAPFEATTLKWACSYCFYCWKYSHDLACIYLHVLEYIIYANISEYVLQKTKIISFIYLYIMAHTQHWFKKMKIVWSHHVTLIGLVSIKYRKLRHLTQQRCHILAGKLKSFPGSSLKPSCNSDISFSVIL